MHYTQARSLQELRNTPTADLVRLHDDAAGNTPSVGVDYFLNELARRETAAQTKQMVLLTRAIAFFTVIVTAATVVSTIYVLTH
jgi:hypothetical protein